MKLLQLLALSGVLICTTSVVHAGNDDCDHPRFQEVGCTYPGDGGGTDGTDGTDGVDGVDGIDGVDGESIVGPKGDKGDKGDPGESIQGIQGIAGLNGRAGRDGVVDRTLITELRSTATKFTRYSAASEALQIYLPQDQSQRVTFGVGQFGNQTGYGVGYAYKTKRPDNLAFTLGFAQSGSERVGKASVGFEFGGNTKRPHKHNMVTECNYVGGVLSMDQQCVGTEDE